MTYDLQVRDDITAGDVLTNEGGVTNYSSKEGGDNYSPGDDPDPAESTIAGPEITKTLISSSIENAVNARNRAVIGETLTYEVVVTIPEGVTLDGELYDLLDYGLVFV